MAKLYTQFVRDCAECPNLACGRQSYWCPEVGRKLDPLPQAPPADCIDESETWDDGPIPTDECAPLVREWPLPNVWLGVSVEDQRRADERIPHLLRTPAAVRFLSCEPLLEMLDLTYPRGSNPPERCCSGRDCGCFGLPVNPPLLYDIDLVITGSESGPGARPCQEDWIRSLRDQCVSAGTAFFYKQWAINGRKVDTPELDGKRWVEFPEVRG